MSPALVQERFTAASDAGLGSAKIAGFLEKILADRGIQLKPLGTRFLCVFTASEHSLLPTDGGPVRPVGAKPDITANFPVIPIDHVFEFYASLKGRTLVPLDISGVRFAAISFKTAEALTREETIFALDVIFALAGVEVVPVGATESKVVSKNRPR